MPHKTTSLIPPKKPGYAISCASWLPLPLAIRVHSWFLLSPLLFRGFRAFRGLIFLLPFVSIRVHSWFLLSPLIIFVYFVFFVVNPCFCPFVVIRVHSWFKKQPDDASGVLFLR